MVEGHNRVIIENVRPQIDDGHYPIKRVVGGKVIVEADIFVDGHDSVAAALLHRKDGEESYREVPMKLIINDRWKAEFSVDEVGIHKYTMHAYIDHFNSWRNALQKKYEAGQDIAVELLIGAEFVEEASKRASGNDRKKLVKFAEILKAKNSEGAVSAVLDEELTELMRRYPDKESAAKYGKELSVVVDREKALFSTWYERFPRSSSPELGKHGTLRDLEKLIPEIARMGFDVLYLPPIHPIGETNRKGVNNSPTAKAGDVGSPWAIGAKEGGHKSIHPDLGTFDDFERLVRGAKGYGIDVAIDLAYQCSPDHPYVKEHPEWFKWRPDGTVQYAENPPKKYEDVLPINFETENWKELWKELKSVVVFWVKKGVRIFRVDNPHTKPFPFWEWLITGIKKDYPDIIFLSEAFTRPKVMYKLAKIGFTQSYTYFTWRNTKKEFIDYLSELTETEVAEYFKPNFWPNTPDILPEHLQFGARPAFLMRLVLAGTLSSNYGIYGPAFELCVTEALAGREEYLNSEKYEIKYWEWNQPGNLRDFIARVNKIRRDNPALQSTRNLKFYEADNESILFYGKATEDLSNVILVSVNLDPYHRQAGWVKVPIKELGIDANQPYLVHDLLSDDKYIWQGERNYVELNPQILPARIFRVRKKLKRETDFDYFM